MQKMPSQQLLLSWKDHNGALVSVFKNLLKNNTLVDCTLAAEGQYLKAHKVVLSACSSYFELLFSQESEKHPIVILKDVKFQELEAAVNFMYRGEVEVCENRLAAFLDVADSLQIRGLGSDRKTQWSKGKSSVKSSNAKSVVSPEQQYREDALSSHSDSAEQSPNVSVDCELGNSESSSVHQVSRTKSSCSSPPLPYATPSNRSGQNTQNDQDMDIIHSSSTAVSQFSSGVINPVIKTEPVTDSYGDEKKEADGDYGDDVTMMADQEDWDEHNIDNMSDEHPANQQDHGSAFEHMKTEGDMSANVEGAHSGNQSSLEGGNWIQEDDGQHFSSIFVKDEPSTSRSWNHQEPYGDGESHPSVGTSAASDGPESVFIRSHRMQKREPTDILQAAGGSHALKRDSASPEDMPVLWGVHHAMGGYICPECKKRFRRFVDLKRHLPWHDSNESRKCPECGYIAASYSVLLTHKRTHSGERPYQCNLCDYKSSLKGNLVKHQLKHSGIRPCICPHCGYGAINNSILRRHMLKHTGEKPHACRMCEATFTRTDALRRHVLKVHEKSQI